MGLWSNFVQSASIQISKPSNFSLPVLAGANAPGYSLVKSKPKTCAVRTSRTRNLARLHFQNFTIPSPIFLLYHYTSTYCRDAYT